MDRRRFLQGSAALAAGGSFGGARAQLAGNAFIISGFPAGGMGDHVAAALARKLRGRFAAGVGNRLGGL